MKHTAPQNDPVDVQEYASTITAKVVGGQNPTEEVAAFIEDVVQNEAQDSLQSESKEQEVENTLASMSRVIVEQIQSKNQNIASDLTTVQKKHQEFMSELENLGKHKGKRKPLGVIRSEVTRLLSDLFKTIQKGVEAFFKKAKSIGKGSYKKFRDNKSKEQHGIEMTNFRKGNRQGL